MCSDVGKKELTANGIAAETSFGRRRDWVECVEWSEVCWPRQYQPVVSFLYVFYQSIEKLTSYSWTCGIARSKFAEVEASDPDGSVVDACAPIIVVSRALLHLLNMSSQMM